MVVLGTAIHDFHWAGRDLAQANSWILGKCHALREDDENRVTDSLDLLSGRLHFRHHPRDERGDARIGARGARGDGVVGIG